MSSAIARLAVTPSQRPNVQATVRPRPATARLAPPSRQILGPGQPRPPAPTPSRRHALLGLLGAGAAHAAAVLRKQTGVQEEPWLACGLEPYSEQPLADSPAGRALYPSGRPRLQDVKQGGLGDCYLLAALLAVVHKWPWRITQRVRITGVDADGTAHFKIGLHSYPREEGDKPRTDWICVSSKFPPPGAQGGLWVSLFEKAFAKHNDAYKVLRDPSLQGYAALDIGGLGEGLEALTGRRARSLFFANATAPEGFLLPQVPNGHVSSLFKRARTAGFLVFGNWTPETVVLPGGIEARRKHFADGSSLTSFGDMHHMHRPGIGGFTVYGHHAYAVLDVNASGDILVCNPHGRNPHSAGAAFWVPRRCVERMVVGCVAVSV